MNEISGYKRRRSTLPALICSAMVCSLPRLVALTVTPRSLCVAGLVVPEFRRLIRHEAPDDFAANTLGKVASRSVAEWCRVGLGDVPQLGQILIGPMLQARIIDLKLNADGGHGSASRCVVGGLTGALLSLHEAQGGQGLHRLAHRPANIGAGLAKVVQGHAQGVFGLGMELDGVQRCRRGNVYGSSLRACQSDDRGHGFVLLTETETTRLRSYAQTGGRDVKNTE